MLAIPTRRSIASTGGEGAEVTGPHGCEPDRAASSERSGDVGGAHCQQEATGKVGPLGAALVARDLATNPWSLARTRADMTGAVLADLIARTDHEASSSLVTVSARES
jgi:hypothetical protein